LNFNVLDFDYQGNTAPYEALIKQTHQGSYHRSGLDHAMSLRTWQIKGNFKASEPFMYPAPKEGFDSVGLDKPTFGESHDLKVGNIARH
jgi:hypothetical protein